MSPSIRHADDRDFADIWRIFRDVLEDFDVAGRHFRAFEHPELGPVDALVMRRDLGR